MDSQIDDYRILTKLSNDTEQCVSSVKNAVAQIDQICSDIQHSAQAEVNEVRQKLEYAQSKLEEEQRILEELEHDLANASEENRSACQARVNSQRERVNHARANVERIRGIFNRVQSAAEYIRQSCSEIRTAKERLLSQMSSEAGEARTRLTQFRQEMEEADDLFKRTLASI